MRNLDFQEFVSSGTMNVRCHAACWVTEMNSFACDGNFGKTIANRSGMYTDNRRQDETIYNDENIIV